MWEQHPNFADARVRYHLDDGHVVRQVQQDAEPVLEANRRLSNETGGWNRDRTMKKVASVPATVFYSWVVEWQYKGLLPDMTHPEFQRMANDLCLKRVRDSDYSGFRI